MKPICSGARLIQVFLLITLIDETRRLTPGESMSMGTNSEFSIGSRTLSRADESLDHGGGTSSAHSFNNRDAHVKLLMKKRESEFLHIEKLRLFCGTWNVNGRPASEDIMPWFKNAMEDPPALIALGFQELDLSKEALVFADSTRESEWRIACETAVNAISDSRKYKTVKLVRLVGVMLILFAADDLVPFIDNVAMGTVATGIMGVLGNKGGVAIRLSVHNSSICLVTSHLAAHMEQVDRRNQDFKDISERMVFSNGQPDVNSNVVTISGHDLTFWFGDLNYRITDVPIDKVKLLIKDKNYNPLIERDQLLREKDAKKTFRSFSESPLTFDPTYKYDVGTDEYDTSEKMRVPAWTDRVLHKGKHITPLLYDCHQELRLSDHKPVSHTYDIGVKVINRENYRFVYEDVMKQLDKLENEFLPQVKLDITELNYGEVKFMEPKSLSMVITNTGQVPADFVFIPKLNESSYCKSWMSIRPYRECILPNESATVELALYVSEESAWLLNSGKETVEDILVLHLDGGKDFFLTINGNYIASSFGCSIHALVQMQDTISQLSRQQIAQLENASGPASSLLANQQPPLPVPKELWFLCNSINDRGKFEEDLFQQRGLHQEIIAIRNQLDSSLTGQLSGNIHSAAEALLIFLEALREPVISFDQYDDALSAASTRIQCVDVVNRLPASHKAVFEYLIEFMVELLKHSDKNRLDVNILGNVFGPILIRSDVPVECSKDEKDLIAQRKAMFIRNFLTEAMPNP